MSHNQPVKPACVYFSMADLMEDHRKEQAERRALKLERAFEKAVEKAVNFDDNVGDWAQLQGGKRAAKLKRRVKKARRHCEERDDYNGDLEAAVDRALDKAIDFDYIADEWCQRQGEKRVRKLSKRVDKAQRKCLKFEEYLERRFKKSQVPAPAEAPFDESSQDPQAGRDLEDHEIVVPGL